MSEIFDELPPSTVESAAARAARHGVSREEFDHALKAGELGSPVSNGQRKAQDNRDEREIHEAVLTAWLERR